jgi:hypothetical protein
MGSNRHADRAGLLAGACTRDRAVMLVVFTTRHGGALEPSPRGTPSFDCIGCGSQVAPPLARLGSTRCHDCRKTDLVRWSASR